MVPADRPDRFGLSAVFLLKPLKGGFGERSSGHLEFITDFCLPTEFQEMDHRSQGRPLNDQGCEHHREGCEHDQVSLGKVGRECECRRQRNKAAHTGPTHQQGFPGCERRQFTAAPVTGRNDGVKQERHHHARQDDADHHDRGKSHRPLKLFSRHRLKDAARLQPHQQESHHVQQEDDGRPDGEGMYPHPR